MRIGSGSNRECRHPVAVAWGIRVAIATLCPLVHGCETGKGGAVELSWKLRPASSELLDKFVDKCEPDSNSDGQPGWGAVKQLRLHWRAGGRECSQAWSCQDNHGTTGFDLAEGMAQLWVTPECADEVPLQCTDDAQPADQVPAEANTYTAPATVVRNVTRGEVVSLGAVELVVAVSNCRFATTKPTAPVPCVCDTGLAMDHTSR
jgi:hypothetical protein